MITTTVKDADLARDAALLDPSEAETARRLRASTDRRDYIVAHALLRRTLTAASPHIAPETWRFRRTATGKPYIWPPSGTARAATFSLSHTRGLVACATGYGLELGIDVERDDAALDIDALRNNACSADEIAQLDGISPAGRMSHFLDLWTLKEAYAKACGTGIADALTTTSFDLRTPGIVFASLPPPATMPWSFVVLQPSADSRISLAVVPMSAKALRLDAALVGRNGSPTTLLPVRIGTSDR